MKEEIKKYERCLVLAGGGGRLGVHLGTVAAAALQCTGSGAASGRAPRRRWPQPPLDSPGARSTRARRLASPTWTAMRCSKSSRPGPISHGGLPASTSSCWARGSCTRRIRSAKRARTGRCSSRSPSAAGHPPPCSRARRPARARRPSRAPWRRTRRPRSRWRTRCASRSPTWSTWRRPWRTARAVLALCATYRKALAPFGIPVVALVPGYVDTERLRELNGGDARHKPFLMSEQRAVERMLRAIDAGRAVDAFPWQMRLAVGLLNLVPHLSRVPDFPAPSRVDDADPPA